MKNNYLLFLPIVGILLFSGCATTGTQYASTDDIYYTPSQAKVTVSQSTGSENQELQQLRTKTSEMVAQQSTASADESVVYMDTENGATIETSPNNSKSYVIIDEGDSYERRLRMFDDPRYTITVNMVWSDPWFYNSWYYPYYYRPWNYYWNSSLYYYSYWYFPGWMYPAYSPWYYSFYNPWWGGGCCGCGYGPYYNYGYYDYGPSSRMGSSYAANSRSSSMGGASNSRNSSAASSPSRSRSSEIRQVAGGTRGSISGTRGEQSLSRNGATNNTGRTTLPTTIGRGTEVIHEAGTIRDNRGTTRNISTDRTSRQKETRPAAVTPGRGTTGSGSSRNVQQYTRPETAGRSVYNQGNSRSSNVSRESTMPTSTQGRNSSTRNDSYSIPSSTNRSSSPQQSLTPSRSSSPSYRAPSGGGSSSGASRSTGGSSSGGGSSRSGGSSSGGRR